MVNAVNISGKACAFGAKFLKYYNMATKIQRSKNKELTHSKLEELRDFLDELDVIPLSALPSEVWPLVYEHQRMITAPEFDPHPLEVRFYNNLNKRLRERKKHREQQEQSELIPFNY